MSVNRVTLFMQLYGQTMQNVFYFHKDGQVTADLPALLVSVRDLWVDQLRSWACATVTFVSLLGENLITGEQAALPLGTQGFQSGSATMVPQLALVMQFRTGLSGRNQRGRQFVLGCVPGSMSSGLWSAAHMTQALGFCATLKARWITSTQNGMRLVLHGPNDDATTYRVVNDIVPRATPATLRRRGVGVGA